MPGAKPPFRRFLEQYTVDEFTGCWIWNGHTFSNGYGCLKVLGKEFPSQKSAERELGLGGGTVLYWLKNHPNKAQYLHKGKSK